MNALTRRIRKLEQRVFPPDDEELRRIAEQIKDRRRRRLEEQGFPPEEDDGPRENLRGMTLAEVIRRRRLGRCQIPVST
jgi:cell division septum initiation protein DivIVA